MQFPTDYASILERIDMVHPVSYAKTRNYTDGWVTRLSPYLTHGVISTELVAKKVLQRYSLADSIKLIQELSWREYFKSVHTSKGPDIWKDLRYSQTPVKNFGTPTNIERGTTTINQIDKAIQDLVSGGYIHNHVRMWIAALVCNHAHYHWKNPSQWMYYHLLDGDLASNTLSWQWVAGSFSSKKYYANQTNINTYTKSAQYDSFLDLSYDELPALDISDDWSETSTTTYSTDCSQLVPAISSFKDCLIYHPWMLDPLWRHEESKRKILLIDECHFAKHPISQKRLKFILSLAQNIQGIEIFRTPNIEAIDITTCTTISHPNIQHWACNKDDAHMMFPTLGNEYYKNFFSFWKKAKPLLKTLKQ